MIVARLRSAVGVLALSSVAAAGAATYQFEVLGASSNWVVVRENLRTSPADIAACRYPGLDPSEYVGVRVRFVKLSDAARRGRLVQLDGQESVMPLYTPASSVEGCTAPAEAEERWREIVSRAEGLAIGLAAKAPPPTVLGAPVSARTCELIAGTPPGAKPCSRLYAQPIDGRPIRIAVSLSAVPEAPDGRTCQFVGHRFGVAIQVAGLDFGSLDSGVAPGGFADHYDCRSQQFEPLRLYRLEGLAILLGGFRGTNIADRDEYPFVVVFPTRPAS